MSAELCYITPYELSRYQEGKPAHAFDKSHKEILEEQGYELIPIIIGIYNNYIVRNDQEVSGLHLVKRIENNV